MELTGFNLWRSIGFIKAGKVQCICTIKIGFRWYYNNRLLAITLKQGQPLPSTQTISHPFLTPHFLACSWSCCILLDVSFCRFSVSCCASCISPLSALIYMQVFYQQSFQTHIHQSRTADSELLPNSLFQCPFPSFCLFN